MKAEPKTPAEAARVLEDLRKGIPPSGFVEHFTVGRRDEIRWLDGHLVGDENYALLLNANYGSGKSHLLQLIREKALSRNYSVSLVVLDANSGVRFNRMDQIFGAIMRKLEVPLGDGRIGNLADCLDFLALAAEEARGAPGTPAHQFWVSVSNNWKWDYSEILGSPPLYIAVRAWAASDSPEIRELVLDWLSFPENYRSRRKQIYETLVTGLRGHFRDPRPDWQIYAEDSLTFIPNLYQNCWSALEDFHRMFVASGLTGMAVLFDEFEDVLTNLTRINYKEAAFWNLFRFVSGDRFSGKTFFAVTPSFVEKCKNQLIEKDRWDFDYTRFDDLPSFEMSPLNKTQLLEHSRRIVAIHELAYDYTVPEDVLESMNKAVSAAAKNAVQDRARQAIKSAVQTLDNTLD